MKQMFSVVLYINANSNPLRYQQALDSVWASTVRPEEVYIVADGPVGKDMQDVLAVSVRDKRVRCFFYPVPVGRAVALSRGISQCSYNLIALQSAESVSLPDRFAKQLAYLKQFPETAVVGAWSQEVDPVSMRPICVHERPSASKSIKRLLRKQSPLLANTVLFQKKSVLQAGNYCPIPFGLEDYALWIEMLGHGMRVANLPQVLVNVWSHPAAYSQVPAYLLFKAHETLWRKMRHYGLLGCCTHNYLKFIRFIQYVLLPSKGHWFWQSGTICGRSAV